MDKVANHLAKTSPLSDPSLLPFRHRSDGITSFYQGILTGILEQLSAQLPDRCISGPSERGKCKNVPLLYFLSVVLRTNLPMRPRSANYVGDVGFNTSRLEETEINCPATRTSLKEIVVDIFDIEKDDLLRLSGEVLRELIGRLAEADVAACGHSPASVDYSGSHTAADGRIDVQVEVNAPELNTGFLVRPNTVLQSKKHSMGKEKITTEMLKDGKLHPTLSRQAEIGGGYIIVSLKDDCTPPEKKRRLAAMCNAIADDPNKDKIDLKFYDRSKLAQWVRQHPSVLLWVKGKLGQGYSGWQPYASWSNPPKGAEDTFILAPGVSVHLPTDQGQKVPIEDAIEPMRKLIQSSFKAIRITGLSGIGKTRIVQALFDETVGGNALDRTVAVYVDTGADPDPPASAMLDRLIVENRRAIMIIDNCPPALHSSLANKVSATSSDVTLVTVEYDIRNDKPQTTEVIHIEADGPEIAAELLLSRYPSIGQGNARKIAEFADGNARVSLAIAERVKQAGSLAQFSDAELFDRLFWQRKGPDDILREHAEVLSLVYSFSVSAFHDGQNELEVLGSFVGHRRDKLFRSMNKLKDRDIVQKRDHWRAILPHVIANRLAASALNCIPVETLRAIFETPGRHRLLMSFAHRLGLMHDHAVAEEIVEAWLQPDGLLGQIRNLDENGSKILSYIGPVTPKTLLDRIEAELTAPDFRGLDPLFFPSRTAILNFLQSMAYEPEAFGRCIRLLITVADHEGERNTHDAVRDKISKFFQPYLSGTHASLEQRLEILLECLESEQSGRKSLGIMLLSTALDGPPWAGFDLNEFGARPRDYGYQPSGERFVKWRSAFIDVGANLATSSDSSLRFQARRLLANEFRSLWRQQAIRNKLAAVAKQINDDQHWGEGWKAVRSTIYFDYTKRIDMQEPETLPQTLAVLDSELEPLDLVSKIQTYVLSEGHAYWALDSDFDLDSASKFSDAEKRLFAKATKLGEDFAASTHQPSELGPDLFLSGWMPGRFSFGRGLAKGAHDQRKGWTDLICQLNKSSGPCENFSVIRGFIDEVASSDLELSKEFLDECAAHPKLRQILVGLHSCENFSEADLDRCMALLDEDGISPGMFGHILWEDHYAHLPSERLINLAKRILSKPNGNDALLDALVMKLHGKDTSQDALGPELRKLGLQAMSQSLRIGDNFPAGPMGYNMNEIIGAALRFDGNETEKEQWLNAIFSTVDKGYIASFEEAIATTAELMPSEFLDRVVQGDEEQQAARSFFIRSGGVRRSPLSKVKLGDLIDWCKKRHEPGDWGLVASGIQLWQNNENQEGTLITPLAIEFLEAAPEPKIVLQTYVDRVTPSAWSGSRANIMQPRADAIRRLTQHKSGDLANEAKLVSERLSKEIELVREHEQREVEDREQRFE